MAAIKSHIYVIIKLMLNQFISAIFALVLFMSTYRLEGLCLAASVFAIFFYLYLTYSLMWETGAKDEVSINTPGKLTGLYIMLFAQIPTILSTVAHFISSFFLSEGETFADSLYAATYVINVMFIQSMYSGLLEYFTPDNVKISALAILLTLIPAMVVGLLGYSNGRKGFKLFPNINKPKNK